MLTWDEMGFMEMKLVHTISRLVKIAQYANIHARPRNLSRGDLSLSLSSETLIPFHTQLG